MSRKNDSILELLIQAPWWVSALLAAMAYVGFVHVLPSIVAESPVFHALKSAMAPMGLLVAAFLLLLAAISFIHRLRRKRRLDRQLDIKSIRNLHQRS